MMDDNTRSVIRAFYREVLEALIDADAELAKKRCRKTEDQQLFIAAQEMCIMELAEKLGLDVSDISNELCGFEEVKANG